MLAHGGVIGASGVSAVSTRLVGDNTTPTGFDTIDPGEFFFNFSHWTAVASGTPATICIYIGTTLTASNIVAAVYDSGNILIAQSSAKAIVENSWNVCNVTGSPGAIVSGQQYRVGLVQNGYLNIGRRTNTWTAARRLTTYPDVPADLNSGVSQTAPPEPAIYVMS